MTTKHEALVESQPDPAGVTQAALWYGLGVAACKGDAAGCGDFVAQLGDEANAKSETVLAALRIGLSYASYKGSGRDAKLFVQMVADWTGQAS